MRIFEKILFGGKPELMHNLIWLLTHLADSEKNRNIILHSKLFTQVLELLENNNPNHLILRNGIWLISTISMGFSGEMTDVNMVGVVKFLR